AAQPQSFLNLNVYIMIRVTQDDVFPCGPARQTEECMRRKLVSTLMLTLVAALALCTLPGSATDAQTRRTRRKVPTTTLVPAGTELRVRLNRTLSSKDARVGDKFTATVVNPSRYEEAKINGHISSIKKSGRVEGRTSMSLSFDSIRLVDGRDGAMRAEVVRVYD